MCVSYIEFRMTSFCPSQHIIIIIIIIIIKSKWIKRKAEVDCLTSNNATPSWN